jgi:predicted kinase
MAMMSLDLSCLFAVDIYVVGYLREPLGGIKMSKLLLLCGVPGSGKSTWAKDFIANNDAILISRDSIRFSLLKEGEDYFSHETEVTECFYNMVHKVLEAKVYDYVIADATHNTGRSRSNALMGIEPHMIEGVEIIPVYFNIPIEICKERNAQREGRARVPDEVIDRMGRQRIKPKERGERFCVGDVQAEVRVGDKARLLGECQVPDVAHQRVRGTCVLGAL